jgi:hypothetical protein
VGGARMKNVEETFSNRPSFRVFMRDAPPPKGWFVRYVAGMDKPEIKAGFWLTKFFIDAQGYINFNFEPVADLHWDTEERANEVSKALLESAEIETKVVKVGF